MVYQTNEQGLAQLLKPACKVKVNETIPDGYDKLEKLEKRVDKLQKAYAMDHALLLSYVAQFETLKRRVMELESKNIS
jgi:hypothetical protein